MKRLATPRLLNHIFPWVKDGAVRLAVRRDHPSQMLFHLFYGLHNRLLRLGPGSITTSVHGISLEMPAEHLLPLYVSMHPNQDKPLAELAAKLHQADGFLYAIDVGANIGDTALMMRKAVASGTFLCVEGSERFLPYLQANLAAHADREACFFVESVLLGERNETLPLSLHGGYGTASLQKSAGHSQFRSLDSLLQDVKYRSLEWNLIKIDTDGHEQEILNGATAIIAKRRPALFIEYAPRVLIEKGSDRLEIFRWLAKAGYTDLAIFTSAGELLMRLNTTDLQLIDDLAAYSLNTGTFHYDVLAVAQPRHVALLQNRLAASNETLSTST
jgi:FkbM family methyltransferase